MDHLAERVLRDVALDEIAPKSTHHSTRNPTDHWTLAILLERGAYLKKMAKYGDGSAIDTLREYPRHSAMLVFQSRDGEAQVHQDYAHLFCLLAGSAILVTDGTLTRPRTLEPGQTRGDSIEGGTRQELKQGDIAHVPSGLPHQLLISGEKTITCFVIKIKETE
jgi:mannose-6-phosphate isomerase-like protein (cupin superfamily)